jgi:hypothetical protein
MRKQLCCLLGLMATIAVLVGCGVSAGSPAAQLAFEAQMNVDASQRFHVSLGVRNAGEQHFREDDAFNGTMELRDSAGTLAARVGVVTLRELAPGDEEWAVSYGCQLPAGAYQLTWGAPGYGSVTVDFTLIEMDGQLYLGEQSIQSTTSEVPGGERLVFVPQEAGAPQGSITADGVQVTAGEQIAVYGRSTLPDGTCLGSELWGDGELEAWWPGGDCVPVEGGSWRMVVALGQAGAPAEVDPSAQYMLRFFQQNGPNIVAVFAFDLSGPPAAEP